MDKHGHYIKEPQVFFSAPNNVKRLKINYWHNSKFFKIKREVEKIEDYLKKSPSIFISHQPKDYKIATKSNASLFLCGHTHGGQIYPFHYFVKLVQPFLAGLFYRKNTAIYVNKGVGTWGINFRYKANAEITILKLISKTVE